MAGRRWHLLGHAGGKYSPFVRPLPPPLPTQIASTRNGHKLTPFSTAWPHSPLHGPILHYTGPICTARAHSTLHGPNLHCTAPFYTTRPHSDLHRPHSHPSAFSLPPSRLLTRSRLDAHLWKLEKGRLFPPTWFKRSGVFWEAGASDIPPYIYIYIKKYFWKTLC